MSIVFGLLFFGAVFARENDYRRQSTRVKDDSEFAQLKEIQFSSGLMNLEKKSGTVHVIGIYDKKLKVSAKYFISRILVAISHDPILREHSLSYHIADFNLMPGWKESLGVKHHTALLYTIGKVKHYFKDFDELGKAVYDGKIGEEVLVEKCKKFLLSRIRKLRKLIKSESEFHKKLEKYGQVMMYFGHKRSKLEENVFKLNWAHSHPPMYRIHDRELAANIFNKHSKEPLGDREMFCMFRHDHSKDDLDHDTMVCMKVSKTYEKMHHFYHIHQHKKLLTNRDWEAIANRFQSHRERAIIYTYNNATNSSGLEEFKKAIDKLHKHYVYIALNLDGQIDSENFLRLLGMKLKRVVNDTVYASEYDTYGPEVHKIDAPLTAKNILHFIHKLYKDWTAEHDRHARKSVHKHMEKIEEHIGEL